VLSHIVKYPGHGKMKAIFVSLILLAVPPLTTAQNCSALNKHLGRLRLEYHAQAAAVSPGGATASFDELMVTLDKIVDLKNSMRKLSCDILPRQKNIRINR